MDQLCRTNEEWERRLRELESRAECFKQLLRAIRSMNQLVAADDDAVRLVDRACKSLTDAAGYRNAWIFLLEEDGRTVKATATSGPMGDSFAELEKRIRAAQYPDWMTKAMACDRTIVVSDPPVHSPECAVTADEERSARYCRRLCLGGKMYGVLSVSVPARGADDLEEQALFMDVADDLVFALHRLEITERLRESRRRYRELFEGSRDGLVMVDPAGRILEANPAFCSMLGYTLDELRALPDFYAVTPEHWREWEAKEIWENRLLRQGHSGLYEKEYIRKDGTVFPVELWSRAVMNENGEIEYLWGLARDITSRKQMEAKASEGHDCLLAIFDSIDEPVYVADPETYEVLFLNRAIQDVFGEPGPRKCYDFLQGRREPCPFCTNDKIFGEYLGRSYVWEFQNESNGRWYRCIDKAIPWPDGRMVRYEMAIDVTDRKQAEQEREDLQAQLSQIYKMESVGRLAGGIAHDFNNMLGVILGYADLALQKTEPGEPLRADLEHILEAARHSAQITSQLLAFARKQTFSPRLLDLNEVVEEPLKMLRRLIGEGIDVVWVPDRDPGLIKMDPSQVNQILTNLCVNARDAIDGIGKITIETGRASFTDEYCRTHAGFVPGEYAMLAVSDDGCGIDPETVPHLFEPFYTTKDMEKGTGLGLATVYGIVKQNNGFINVYSEQGRGSTFKIYFERHDGTAAPLRREIPADRKQVCVEGAETILLVEDDPVILEMTRKMIERFGYRVLSAATPTEALNLMGERAADIHMLITDLIMPEMNGRDLANETAALNPDIKTLYMSGYTANVIAHHGVLDQGAHFIQKPFTMEELASKVREVLDFG